MRRVLLTVLTMALGAGVMVLPAVPAAGQTELETVATGVDNGRGLTFDDAGNLHVAASGVGGDGPCITGPEGGETCYGETGAILRFMDAASLSGDSPAAAADNELISGLPSLAIQGDNPATPFGSCEETGGEQPCDPPGTNASGPADVSLAGTFLYYSIGLGADPAVRDEAPLDGAGMEDEFATLHRALAVDGSGDDQIADLGAHEAEENPDDGRPGMGEIDTNPFGIVAGGESVAVADSGGNTLLDVAIPSGDVTTNQVFDPVFVPAPPFMQAPAGTRIPSQPVPTQLTEGSEPGTLDVGQLTGFPFYPGSASVSHVDATGERSTLETGFTNVMDVAWGPDGNLYVLEISHDGLLNDPLNGALIRVSTAEDGTVTRDLLIDDVLAPGGIAFDPTDEGMLYLTVGSPTPDGTVARLDAVSAEPLVSVTDDSAETEEDQRLVADDDAADDEFQVTTDDVTANDDEDVTVESVPDNSQGAAEQGSVVYTPPAHVTGDDQVTYRGCDGDEHCLIGVLDVTVTETETDRVAGETRLETAVEASRTQFPDGTHTVVIARSDLYPDALAGGPLARQVDAPILLTPGDELHATTATEINRLGATTAYVLGGPAAVSDAVEQALVDDTSVTETTRLEGADRFATAVAIKGEMETVTGSAATAAYVAEGMDPDENRGWPDAVAVSALASHTARPILLVETDRLPDATAQALDGLDTATIVGGLAAVNQDVQDDIDEVAGTVNRLAGATRYVTSLAVAQAGLDEGLEAEPFTLVSGGNWPDALVAGPLVAGDGGTLMLVHPEQLDSSPQTRDFIDNHEPLSDIDIYGGSAAISDGVETAVRDAHDEAAGDEALPEQ